MNAPTLWLRDFPTHGVPSVKTDRSLAPLNKRGTRPRKKKLTSDRCPACVIPSTPPQKRRRKKRKKFPLLPGMNKGVQLPCFTPGSPSSILFKGNITLPAKRPNVFPQSSQDATIGWQITWEYIRSHSCHRLYLIFISLKSSNPFNCSLKSVSV